MAKKRRRKRRGRSKWFLSSISTKTKRV